MPMMEAPGSICGATTRVSASRALALAASVQSQCRSSVSSAGRITPVAALWTNTSSGPSRATSSRTRAEETLPRGSPPRRARGAPRRSPRRRRRSGGGDRHSRGAELGEAERDRPADPARPTGHEDRRACEAHGRRGCGTPAGSARKLLPAEAGSRLPLAALGLGGGVPEVVEQAHLLLAVAAHRMVGREVLDQLEHAGPELVGEVRRGGARRERRCRGSRARPWRRKRNRRSGGAPGSRADAADDGRALGAQPHRHPLHPRTASSRSPTRPSATAPRRRDLRRDRRRGRGRCGSSGLTSSSWAWPRSASG